MDCLREKECLPSSLVLCFERFLESLLGVVASSFIWSLMSVTSSSSFFMESLAFLVIGILGEFLI